MSDLRAFSLIGAVAVLLWAADWVPDVSVTVPLPGQLCAALPDVVGTAMDVLQESPVDLACSGDDDSAGGGR